MKFRDFLMEGEEEQKKRLDLEEEVAELQQVLEKEQKVNRVLKCALHGPIDSLPRSSSSSSLPIQVQALLDELAMVEQEIIWLERKVEELKLCLHREKNQLKGWRWQQAQQKQQHRHYKCRLKSRKGVADAGDYSQLPKDYLKSQKIIEKMTAPQCAAVPQMEGLFQRETNGEKTNKLRHCDEQEHCHAEKTRPQNPNKLSEELIICLTKIFLKLKQASSNFDSESIASKLSLSCMSSKGCASKSSFKCKTHVNSSDGTIPMLDPYSMLPDPDGTDKAIGSYKKFVQFTESSFDMSCISECIPDIRRLRMMITELGSVDIRALTYKQKLAFWINVYNGSIMQAFLQHGVPSSQDKVLTLLNKAAVNVGGIVLNALAIEHFILRHRYDPEEGDTNEKEALLRHTYGLGYPEPNVTFALCRGTWSSPALRVYTGEDIMNELERAKLEYLEASIGITSKRRILLPKLLHWHMKDFADDIESLLEWTYSQFPRAGSLKRLIMECLTRDSKLEAKKLVEIQPYEAEFRYLLPV